MSDMHIMYSFWASHKCVKTALTSGRVPKFLTHYSSISTSPGVITHSAPHIVHTDLNSAFICNVTSCQLQLTSCASNCAQEIYVMYLCVCSWIEKINVPSQPTPASAEWMQLCESIGLLEHSSSWLELKVHWTSSRKIGPLPVPKWALLNALPAACTGMLDASCQYSGIKSYA